MGKLLILGASDIQVPSIIRAKALGHTVLVADYDPLAPGLAHADVPVITSTNDIEAILKAAKLHAVHGIVTTSDFPVRTVAAVGLVLGLPVLSNEAAVTCTDKYLQRELMAKASLPTPWFFNIRKHERVDPCNVASWPAVVKPVDSSASRGVSRVDNETELLSAIELARLSSRSEAVIVEEYISGPEFSVEVLCHDGQVDIIAITGKSTAGEDGRFFVETRHVIPADITPEEDIAIRTLTKMAVSACGLNHAAAHVEVKFSPGGPVLIEMAARLGGDHITSDLVPLATGVDMVEAILNMALGLPVHPTRRLQRFSGIQFVTPSNYAMAENKIRSLQGHPGLCRFHLLPKPKHSELRSSMDRLGFWIVVADSRPELTSLLDC